MNKINNMKIFIKNIGYALLAQIISLCLSIIMSLMIPKVLGIESYGYWQLFLFYSSYVGFFAFGLNDGIYLRFGGTEYSEYNYSLLGTQMKISIIFQVFLCILFMGIIKGYSFTGDREFVLICTAMYVIIFNTCNFVGYLFQASNQTRVFSISVIIDKLLFLIFVLILIKLKINNFKIYIILYIISKFIGCIYCIYKGEKIVFSKFYNIKVALSEIWINIKVGIPLMIANIASMLILGISRFIVDDAWGISAFGKFSFALSLTNFFLLFITQISMVMFPTLRIIEKNKLNKLYNDTRNGLTLLLPVILVVYIPMKYILCIWLPQYQESVMYLSLLLPLCIFDGKMQMIYNTYFKVLRKEKAMLYINIIIVLISTVLNLIGVYLFNNIYVVVVFMVTIVAFRSIISDIYISRVLNEEINNNIISEIMLIIIFMSSAWYLNDFYSFIIILNTYVIYLLLNRDNLKLLVKKAKLILSE